jgi:hypothetical protein
MLPICYYLFLFIIISVPSFLWTATIILLNIGLTGNKTVDLIFSSGKNFGAKHLKHAVLKCYFAFYLMEVNTCHPSSAFRVSWTCKWPNRRERNLSFCNVWRHNIIKALLIVNGSIHRILAPTACLPTGINWRC